MKNESEIYRQDNGRYPLALDELKTPKYHGRFYSKVMF